MEAEEFQPQATERDECPDEVVERTKPDVRDDERAGVAQEEPSDEADGTHPEWVSSADEVDEIHSEQVSSSDEADKRDPAPQSSSPSRQYPFRQRCPPTTLTYDTLSQPSVTHTRR